MRMLFSSPVTKKRAAPIWLEQFEEQEMLSIKIGGRHVAGSAVRAPLPIDRMAVGEITATNSPERANDILGGLAGGCSGIKCGVNRTGTESETSGDSVERHAPVSNSPMSTSTAKEPEAADPQAPNPNAASGRNFPVMTPELARSEAEKCGRRVRICMDAGAYDEARHQLGESKRFALLALELEGLA